MRKPNLDRQRIDKWLWHARMVRTRSAAAALAEAGYRAAQRQAHDRRRATWCALGDVVTLALDRSVKVVQVEGFCERRGERARRPRALPRFDNEFRQPRPAPSPASPVRFRRRNGR